MAEENFALCRAHAGPMISLWFNHSDAVCAMMTHAHRKLNSWQSQMIAVHRQTLIVSLHCLPVSQLPHINALTLNTMCDT